MRKKLIVTLTLIAAVAILPMAAFADATPDGASLFKSKCAACHGADAAKKLDGVKTMSEADVAKVIANGKDAKPMKMPAYTGKLTNDEINAIAKYLKGIKK